MTRGRWRPRLRRGLRELLLVVVLALVVAALLRAFVVQAFVVPSGSMTPTIGLEQRILVSKIGPLQRGEVVVFTDPGHWIPNWEARPSRRGSVGRALELLGVLPDSGASHVVKRVIGLPGDHVVCCDRRGRVSVNGQPLDETSYLHAGDAPSQTTFDVVVPRHRIFVLGDHRSRSGDSRYHLDDGTAFVPDSLVTGRAVAVIWPLSHVHVLHIPPDFARVPAPRPAPVHAVVRDRVGEIRLHVPG